MGRLLSGGGGGLKSALKKYAGGTGGSSIAITRMQNIVTAGTGLHDTLSQTPGNRQAVNLRNLTGMDCETAIEKITRELTPVGGDADTIRAAMNHALSNALEGVENFDENAITEDIIVEIMIEYLSDSIFQGIIRESSGAFEKADSPLRQVKIENELREVIRVDVDRQMKPLIDGNIRTFSLSRIESLQNTVIKNVWEVWED